MFCSKCGKQLNNDENFCSNCGFTLKAEKDNKFFGSKNLKNNFLTLFYKFLDFIKWKKFKKLYLIITALLLLLLLINWIRVIHPTNEDCNESNIKFISEAKVYKHKTIDEYNIFETKKEAIKNCKRVQRKHYSNTKFDFISDWFDDLGSNWNNLLDSQKSAGNNFVCGNEIQYSGGPNEGKYNTVKIGGQCWFKENLNIGTLIAESLKPENNNSIEKYCYDNNETNCSLLGGFYKWDEAMNYKIDNAQGICPASWHIPTDQDWYILESYLSNPGEKCDKNRWIEFGCNNAGVKLKASDYCNGFLDCGSSGFDVKFGSSHKEVGETKLSSFFWFDTQAFFWTSSENGPNDVWERTIDFYINNLDSSNDGNTISKRLNGVSRGAISKDDTANIRCILN